MSRIRSDANYSQIRREVQTAFDKQGKSKNLRFQEGKGLYLHDSKDTRRSNIFMVGRRAKKHLDATQKIRESLNREFPNIRDLDGDVVKVGDLVFQRLNSPKKLDHEAFKKIDQEVANILHESGEAAIAKHFELSAGSTTGALRLANWPRVQNDASAFRDALIADAMASGQSRNEAQHTCDAVVKELKSQGAEQSSGRNLQDIDLGVNMQTIEKAVDSMQGQGLGCSSLKNLAHRIRLNRQFRTVVPQLRKLNDDAQQCVSRLNINGSNQLYGQVIDFVDQNEQILGNFGSQPHQVSVGQLTQQMTRARVLVHLLESKNPQGGWDQQVADNLRDQINAINELSVSSLSADRRLNFARRPMTSHFAEMNVENKLHSMQLPNLGDEVGIKLKANEIYDGAKGPGTAERSQGTFDRVATGYVEAMKQVDVALEAFQENHDDSSLARLADAVNLATIHSDRYSKLLSAVSRRRVGSQAQSSLSNARNLVVSQRKTLQQIGRSISQVNDTRNAIAQGVALPGAADVDREAGRVRDVSSRALANQQANQLIYEQSRNSVSSTAEFYLPANRTRGISESSSQDIQIPQSNNDINMSNANMLQGGSIGQGGQNENTNLESYDFSVWDLGGKLPNKQQDVNALGNSNSRFRSPSLSQNDDVDYLSEAPGDWDETVLLELSNNGSSVEILPGTNPLLNTDSTGSKESQDIGQQIPNDLNRPRDDSNANDPSVLNPQSVNDGVNVGNDDQAASVDAKAHVVVANAAQSLKAEISSQWPENSNPGARGRALRALDFLVNNADKLAVDESIMDGDIADDWDEEKYDLKDAVRLQFGANSSQMNKLELLTSAVYAPENQNLLDQLKSWGGVEPPLSSPEVVGSNSPEVSQVQNNDQLVEPLPLENENPMELESSVVDEPQQSLPVVDYQTAIQNLKDYLDDPLCEDIFFGSVINEAKYNLGIESRYGPGFALSALNELGMNYEPDDNSSEEFVAQEITRFIAEHPLRNNEPVDNAPVKQVDSKEVVDLCLNSFKMSPDALRKEVASIMGLPDSAVQEIVIKQDKSPYYGNGLQVSYTSTKTDVEKMLVSFYPEQKGADHKGHLNLGLIKLKAGSQGAGSSKKMFAGMLDLMQQTNLRTMSTEANITVGGYVWARMGFHPSNGDFERMGTKGEWGLGSVKGRLQMFVNAANNKQIKVKSGLLRGLQKTVTALDSPQKLDPRKMIRHLMNLSSPIKLNELEGIFGAERAAELKAIAKAGGFKELTLGKALLLGTSWDGTFDVKDDMSHMKMYVAKQGFKNAYSKVKGFLKSDNNDKQ